MPHSLSSIFRVAVIGTGPAGLMAAEILSSAGIQVNVFEKKSAPAKKLLIAGTSGLNVAYDDDFETTLSFYGGPRKKLGSILNNLNTQAWRKFLNSMGINTFVGTSRRIFVEGLKAAPLVKTWTQRLKALGVVFHNHAELSDFQDSKDGSVEISFTSGHREKFNAAILALGGASWEPEETPLRWPEIFKRHKIAMTPFQSSNAGFEIAWPKKFLAEAEGLPIKNAVLTTAKGSHKGDIVITKYGLEGTPVYHVGCSGSVTIDLKPDFSENQILNKLKTVKENLSPLRRAKKTLGLCPAALALLFHLVPSESSATLTAFARLIKFFPLELGSIRPLTEAISSSGGVGWEEVDDNMMLKKIPGIFVAGEMLDWEAPTGGFLVHMCAAQGKAAAEGVKSRLSRLPAAPPTSTETS